MTLSFSDTFLKLLYRHSTVIITILLGAIVDLLAFSCLTRVLHLAEGPSVICAILIAALFNFLILNRVLASERSTSKNLRSLALYLGSVIILIGVRAIVLKIFAETALMRELIYLISMGVSFVINWVVLSCLFKTGGKTPKERTR